MFTFGTLVQITCNRNDKLYNWFYSFNSAAIYTTLNDLLQINNYDAAAAILTGW